MSVFGLQHPFFEPVWRRVALVAACLGWALFEFITGTPIWGIVFASLGLVAIWELFVAPWPDAGGGDD